jgi:RHS repeat-associated protein
MLVVDQKNTLMREVGKGPVNSVAYTAYGHPSAEQSVRAHLGYNGEFSEPQTGWQLLGNGYRAYNSNLMKFHSPDSFSPFGEGGVNAYAYCEGEPILNSDPDGHSMVGNFLRRFRPTIKQANEKHVPMDFLENSKFGEASVRKIKAKDVHRLNKVVKLREIQHKKLNSDINADPRNHIVMEREDFTKQSIAKLNSSRNKIENAQRSHQWAKEHVGKLGITRESSSQLKDMAADYDAHIRIQNRLAQKRYDARMQQYMEQEIRERAMNVRDPKVQKHYLGDGWS